MFRLPVRYRNDAGRAEVMARARDSYAVAHTRLQFLRERFRDSPHGHVVASHLQPANDAVVSVETIASVMPVSGSRVEMEVGSLGGGGDSPAVLGLWRESRTAPLG
jgi:hypothetical protein